jgi:predicted nucleotidyltransferase
MGEARPDVAEILLFGSFARGDYGPRSDLDLLIVLEQSDRPFVERIGEFLRLVPPYPTDVFPYTREEIEARLAEGDPFLGRAIAEGIVLYRRR